MNAPLQKVIILFMLLLCSNSFLLSQWSNTNFPSPGGGYINSIYSIGKHLFVGASEQGVFESINGGENWKAIGLKMPLLEIEKLSLCDSNIIAVSFQGIFVSSLSNNNWIRRDSNLADWGFRDVVSSSNYALTCGYERGVYRSIDNGINWNIVESEYFNSGGRALAMKDSIVFVANDNGLLKSSNYGESWVVNDTGVVFESIWELDVLDSIVCVSSFNNGIFISYNLGESWENIDSTFVNPKRIRIALSDSNLYIGTCENKIISYSYNNKSFKILKEDFPFQCITAMTVSDSNIFIGTSGNGIYLSTDNGITWNEKNKGLTAIEVTDFTYKDDIIFAGSANYGLFASNDGGESWNKANNGIVTDYIYSLMTQDDKVFAGTYDGLYVTENNGINWELTHSLTPHDFTIIENTLYAGGNDGLVYSTDNGKTWKDSPLFFLQNITALTSIDTTLFVGTSLNGIIVVNGSNWFQRNNGIGSNGKSVISFEKTGNTLYVITWGGTYVTNNNGLEWEPIDENLFGGNIQTAINLEETIFVGSKNGIYRSNNYGLTWNSVNTGLTDLDIRNLFTDNNNLFAATGGGIWRRSISELITEVDVNQSYNYDKYILNQNFPNPFNPTTTINYSIPLNAFVSINVYDLLGRNIKTLVNQNKSAGNYNITFDASEISSGIYYYTIKANSFIETKKLVVLK